MIKVWNFEFNLAQGRALPDNEDAGLVQGVFDRMFARLAALEPLARVRSIGGIKGPVVWAPVARAA
jgi:hypothetical protein